MPRHTLICTVGTSLFYPNLVGLPSSETYESWLNKQPDRDRPYLSPDFVEKLKSNWSEIQQQPIDDRNWQPIAELLAELPSTVRLCGAEINSIFDLIDRHYCTPDCKLYFCHSATEDGRQIAALLTHYYRVKKYQVEDPKEIEHLQDTHPKLFRTKGLRNLAKAIGKIVRETGSEFCAIDATGGYKAQIAIGVLMGQALGVPVYYKHERFSEIIAFPPMPVSLDFELWQNHSGLLEALEREELLLWENVAEDWEEKMEVTIKREDIDSRSYITLSPTGQIFHDTFKSRFDASKDEYLPPPVPRDRKSRPTLPDHGWENARSLILRLLQTITDDCPYVCGCRTHYWNPSLPSVTHFRLQGEQIEGIFSRGNWTVKFYVDASAKTSGQQAACIADLNQRLKDWI
ncbi:MAG TPA: putative CRISPR-associated protein [Oscillatoriales cyanobacterium M59_W2019_021]|nr:MAG: putative CRISPR-associated protein [Cyanobacteria bacterium J055]HIK29869.1 putative CRISPR-associated protein [Oscillatoriales cyanobacterium M4454_W2019_049]HIK50009.1 putative CRISPR-associated protein [Oscillatoriales cyanobacterium M59_W2019_021]